MSAQRFESLSFEKVFETFYGFSRETLEDKFALVMYKSN